MIPKPLDSIDATDINRLADDQWPEGQRLEFKGYHDKLPHRDRVLETICAFANTLGGDLVLGIEEKDGLAVRLSPVPADRVDDEKRRVEDWIRTGIEQPLNTYNIRGIDVGNGDFILLIRTEPSWAAPHRVLHTRKFMARNSGGNHQMPMEDIRRTFTHGAMLSERIRAFREERIERLRVGATIPHIEAPWVMLHLVPPAAVLGSVHVDVRLAHELVSRLPKALAYPLQTSRYNLDGVLGLASIESPTLAYIQVFRNGVMEVARNLPHQDPTTLRQGNSIPVAPADVSIVPHIGQYLKMLGSLGLLPPVYGLVTVVGVLGKTLTLPRGYLSEDAETSDRDILLLPDVELPFDEAEAKRALKPVFDAFWNAFGMERCLNYNEDGQYLRT